MLEKGGGHESVLQLAIYYSGRWVVQIMAGRQLRPRIDELLVSYCVNTWEFARLFRDDAVYRPRFVRVKLRLAK